MRTPSSADMFINRVADAVVEEAVKYEVTPEDVLAQVQTAARNKFKCMLKMDDGLDAIARAFEIINNPPPAMCACEAKPLNVKPRNAGVWGRVAPEPRKIVYSGDRTIVFWKDGTKTIVKCAIGQEFDEYLGFVAALAKKLYGSTPKVKKFIDSIKVVNVPKRKKKEVESEETVTEPGLLGEPDKPENTLQEAENLEEQEEFVEESAGPSYDRVVRVALTNNSDNTDDNI